MISYLYPARFLQHNKFGHCAIINVAYHLNLSISVAQISFCMQIKQRIKQMRSNRLQSKDYISVVCYTIFRNQLARCSNQPSSSCLQGTCTSKAFPTSLGILTKEDKAHGQANAHVLSPNNPELFPVSYVY
jgi:hypothetical protein